MLCCSAIVPFVGYIALAYLAFKLLRSAYNIVFPYLFAVPQNLQVLAGTKWALITGGTDGIGKAYAFELAKKGFNLVLVSRSQEKLDAVADEIRHKNDQIEVKTIAFDFTNPNLADYESTIFSQLNEIDIGLLVNNVGMSYDYPERFDRVDGGPDKINKMTVINTVPVAVLSAFFLKKMAERGRGVVVNIASASAYFDWFYLAVYSATKAYVHRLSSILRKEFVETGVIIQTVCPMMVATKMAKVKRTSFFTPSPENFAKEAVRSIGLVDETTGCLAHQIQAEVAFEFVPSFIMNTLIAKNSIKVRSIARRMLEKGMPKEETPLA